MKPESFEIRLEGYWRDGHKEELPQYTGVFCVYTSTYQQDTDTLTIHRLIYIGQSRNIRSGVTIEEKLNTWRQMLSPETELCFSCAQVSISDLSRITAALIFRHEPVLNSQNMFSFPFSPTTILLSGKTSQLIGFFTVYPI